MNIQRLPHRVNLSVTWGDEDKRVPRMARLPASRGVKRIDHSIINRRAQESDGSCASANRHHRRLASRAEEIVDWHDERHFMPVNRSFCDSQARNLYTVKIIILRSAICVKTKFSAAERSDAAGFAKAARNPSISRSSQGKHEVLSDARERHGNSAVTGGCVSAR
jgi:hypothetical protein